MILATLALRNLWSHKVKSAIVGSIMLAGTFLVVFGSAVLDSIERSMEESITSSMAGQAQVFSATAKDELSLFGGFGFGSSDIGEIEDFSKVRESLLTVENVADVVPMGITIATSFGGNDIDRALADLRASVRQGDATRIEQNAGRVRRIAESIGKDYDLASEIVRDKEKVAHDKDALARAISPEFWAGFAADPTPNIEYLERNIAPLAQDGRLFYLRTVGTDLEQFRTRFSKLKIADGELVPPGQRGYLLSKHMYEAFLKNLVARDFDEIKKDWDKGARIADDTLLAERVLRNSRQYKRILFQLDPDQQAALEPKLRAELDGAKGELAYLIESFLKVDDTNIERRYKFFYDEIAPLIRLYEVKPGDILTLRAYTKSGYARAVNVKVYGTYEFEGLEKSDLAGAANLTDLVTWRELYGKMSDAQLEELTAITASVGVQEVSRENAEDALFGGGSAPVETTKDATAGFDEFANTDLSGRSERTAELDARSYSSEELQAGVVLNAAIIMKDPSRADETIEAIRAKSDAAGLGLKVIDWQAAAGMVGQFVVVLRVVLYVSIFMIFLVALVIILISMVNAAFERTAEIGTMRAIGAQRWFVMALFILETMLLGMLAGGAGALLAVLAILTLGQVGIPAPSDILVFLFGGPRLYPQVGVDDVGFGVIVILIVSVLSTMLPAIIAAFVPPVVAMQGRD
jgi:ABC-type lipoprotein release transport system permease subunit